MTRGHRILLALAILCIPTAFMLLVTEQLVEVNTATGSTRVKTRYGKLVSTDWQYSETLVAEAARRQDINTDDDWRFLSKQTSGLMGTEYACGRAPVAYQVRWVQPDYPRKMSQDAFDAFAGEFVNSGEDRRAQMLEALLESRGAFTWSRPAPH